MKFKIANMTDSRTYIKEFESEIECYKWIVQNLNMSLHWIYQVGKTIKSVPEKAQSDDIIISASMDCTVFLGTDIDILEEFGKLGDEVEYYTYVTVRRHTVLPSFFEDLESLKADMEKLHHELMLSLIKKM